MCARREEVARSMEYLPLSAPGLLSRFPPHAFLIEPCKGADTGGPALLGAGGAKCAVSDDAPPQRKPLQAPVHLDSGFDPAEVAPWESGRFAEVRKLQDATRNCGEVCLMHDLRSGGHVAVKRMPTRWVCECHEDFVRAHPGETELPWQDLGCLRFLADAGFPYVCGLHGVFRDEARTYVVTDFATEGDLFAWCENSGPPGYEREVEVMFLARQIMSGVQQLHDLAIVHRDLSMENILLTKSSSGELGIRIIDFSMASTARWFRNSVRGKASYQAPELHGDRECDAFLSDAFSLGVVLYAVILKDYPWLSTRHGVCKCFDYVKKNGLRAFLAKRKVRNSQDKADKILSEPLKHLLEGLVQPDPAQRLTLGERAWTEEGGRRSSVWDEAWMLTGPARAT